MYVISSLTPGQTAMLLRGMSASLCLDLGRHGGGGGGGAKRASSTPPHVDTHERKQSGLNTSEPARIIAGPYGSLTLLEAAQRGMHDLRGHLMVLARHTPMHGRWGHPSAVHCPDTAPTASQTHHWQHPLLSHFVKAVAAHALTMAKWPAHRRLVRLQCD